ncbi:hypothetical protein [Microbacterium sp.]|uniref:hypothetical protein n=1 Tax=Microbacterium sp. TaxID=51671 RepID=UPI003F9DC39C
MALDYVFASGEAPDADTAYRIAQQHLWAKLQRAGLESAVRGIEHSTATRAVTAKGLDIEQWQVEERQISNVIVTLLAAVSNTREKGTRK